ncbi:hypothetical protein L596_021318 [Steinernema carpocapsae]|uniref:Uncharacterized protein n=1 Tax=Steinernema carpocapsae TaxID=34508 RepID=A0A4U5MIQ4_STECR|nr:hypothetical protein L596_021318 [Steinernema carpocapsae]
MCVTVVAGPIALARTRRPPYNDARDHREPDYDCFECCFAPLSNESRRNSAILCFVFFVIAMFIILMRFALAKR